MNNNSVCSNEYEYNDFRYVEFIRNPQDKTVMQNSDIRCIALDYFDVIYAKKIDGFRECMVVDNDIPCEAYQSINLFRKNTKEEGDPFKVNNEYPFFAILQVTLTPEYYIVDESETQEENLYELEKVSYQSKQKFLHEKTDFFKADTAVYYTLNSMDFCVVVRTNQMVFPMFLADKIKSVNVGGSYKKYAIYTVVGIDKDFTNQYIKRGNNFDYIGSHTVLVTRVHLKRCLDGTQQIRKIIEQEQNSGSSITDTYSLPGRYDLSIRVNGSNDILQVLPEILKYIKDSFSDGLKSMDENDNGEGESNDLGQGRPNSIRQLIKERLVEYLNVRILFDCLDSFDSATENGIKKECGAEYRTEPIEVETEFNELKKCLNLITNKQEFKGYLDKLNGIVHICKALYSRYDTNISIKMLIKYVINFMASLRLNIKLLMGVGEGVENLPPRYLPMKDIRMNLVYGINYLQQFIRVVTSVNASSFEAPKYEVEKDECSIVKLPLAYTQFLSEIFKNYKEKKEDEEACYFPNYKPLVIPYLQDGKANYMMTTLFAQNMMDNWEKIKPYWKEHIKSHDVLMFILCQDMNDYRDVSSVISSSLHEIGHYCNGMTREQRNSDLITILCEEIAKVIVKKCLVLNGVNYQSANLATMNSCVLQLFADCVYDGVVEYFNKALNKYITYPGSIFVVKFLNEIDRITEVYADCDKIGMTEDVVNNSLLYDLRYRLGIETERDLDDNEFFPDTVNILARNCCLILQQIGCRNLEIQRDNDMGLFDRVSNYVNSARDLCESVLYSVLNDKMKYPPDMVEQIKLVEKYADEINLKAYCYWEKCCVSENVIKIREMADLLQETSEYIRLILMCYNNHNILLINTLGNQENTRSRIKEIQKNKTELIASISDRYFKRCSELFSQSSGGDFEEVYQRMNLLPCSEMNNFERMLNQVLLGLMIKENLLEQAKTQYLESVADVVMCENLDLTVKEYIAKMHMVWGKDPQLWKKGLRRIVIVIAYLTTFKDKMLQEEQMQERHIKEISENIRTLNDTKTDYCNEEVIRDILENYQYVLQSKMFAVTMSRILKIKKHIKLIGESMDLKFVKKGICLKEITDDQQAKQEVQKGEIAFIQKYYYQNRLMYARQGCGSEKDTAEEEDSYGN